MFLELTKHKFPFSIFSYFIIIFSEYFPNNKNNIQYTHNGDIINLLWHLS